MKALVTRALVTGGAGFIGSHIVDALLAKGCEVLVFDNFSSGREENLADAKSSYPQQLSVMKGDLSNADDVAKAMAFRPEVVYHLAAQISVRHSVSDPVNDVQINVAGTVGMLKLAAEAGVRRVVFSSTGGAIYGEQEMFPAPESHPTRAESPYGVSKRCAELFLDYFQKSGAIEAIALRYSNVYGPRQNAHGEAGVVAIFCEKALQEQEFRINGDGLQTRDYVCVSDVVAANMAVLDLPIKSFEIFNVGTGVERSVVDIVNVIESEHQLAGFTKLLYKHGEALPGEQRRSVIDATKLKNAVKWAPQVAFEDGIAMTYRSFLAKSRLG